jgi:hypothetical protein
LEITKTKTVFSLMLVLITILTTLTLTTTISAYAGDDDNGGDGNKQKAEDDSAAAIADCDDNDVKRAGFDCIAIATNDVEIETEPPSEEPPEEGLVVCKVVEGPAPQGVEPFDFRFIAIGGGTNTQFQGFPPPECSTGIISFVGEYTVTEDMVGSVDISTPPNRVEVEGDCTLVDNDPPFLGTATGEVEEGEIETCTFINTYEDDS